jgi:hypothetical protein
VLHGTLRRQQGSSSVVSFSPCASLGRGRRGILKSDSAVIIAKWLCLVHWRLQSVVAMAPNFCSPRRASPMNRNMAANAIRK